MSLTAGTRLGPYEILAPLGAGGMGEVYKARDTRLDRTVAVKILPAALAGDPQFRERFDREARAISQLTHPNICTLHDVGEHAGTAFLVMELLDGETLADRLTKGALPLDQALKVAIQIADALSVAHRHGIVHRDLKPGNVMLTKTGAKLLDFGLAKASAPAVVGPGLSVMPTTPPQLTAQGTILGTFQYMAPEQIEGQESDARTDVFAFGCVLYEMLTGKKAFEGKTPASLLGAILKDPSPRVSAALPVSPSSLDHVVTTCLVKVPDDRWQSARDVMRELQWVAEGLSAANVARVALSTGTHLTRSRALTWAPAVAAFVFGIVGLTLWVRARTAPVTVRSPSRFVLAEQRPAISRDLVRTFAISPDGRRVVYAAVGDGVRRLYLRDMGMLETKPIGGTENGTDPFFAPDGKRLGFWTGSALKVVSLDGGAPVALVQGVQDRGATWTPNDTIIYSPMTDAGLSSVAATGGTPQIVATPDSAKHERSYRWPHVLPDGDTLLFTIAMSDIMSFDDGRIAVRSLKTGAQHELLRGGSFPSYADPGYLLYTRAGALQAVRFNPTRNTVEGPATTVVDGIVTYPTMGSAQYAISSDGTLLYQPGGADVGPTSRLTWVERTGRSTPIAVPPAPYQGLSISPDGLLAALDIDGANANIWILEFARSTVTRLTLEWSNNTPFWSSDGLRVAFTSGRAGVRSLFWQTIEGHADMEPLTPGRFAPRGSLAPDSQTLAFAERRPDTGLDLWLMAMKGTRQPQLFVQTKFDETDPTFSPDGHWLAYDSNETGHYEVYVQPVPGPGRRVRISTDGGGLPVWSRDGRELFYRKGLDLMAVKVNAAAASLSPQKPEPLFRKRTLSGYDVAPDGRFLMEEPLEGEVAATPITVVINWTEELKRLVPAR